MSGQFPTDPNFRSLVFTDNRPVLINQTLSGKKSARQIGAQYFSFTVQMPPVRSEECRVGQEGRYRWWPSLTTKNICRLR